MHLFFMSRGIKHCRDRMVEGLSALHVPMQIKDGNGNILPYVVQCALQPIELWSYVFPKEHLDTILRTLKPNNEIGVSLNKNHPGYGTATPSRKWSLAMLRKGLGLKSIPKWEEKGLKFPVYTENMHIIGLGIKDDYEN